MVTEALFFSHFSFMEKSFINPLISEHCFKFLLPARCRMSTADGRHLGTISDLKASVSEEEGKLLLLSRFSCVRLCATP